MAGSAEDAYTVLEMFVNDVANLPAEIAHIYEELQAKDKVLKEHRDNVAARDNSLQKHIQRHGTLQEHPKEAQYVEHIRRLQRLILEIQEEKLILCQKAVDLMDKHAKRLDLKISELVRDGQLQQDALHAIPALSNMPVAQNPAQHVRQNSMRASPSGVHARTPSLQAPAISSMVPPSMAGPPTPGASTPGSDPNKRRRMNHGSSSLSLQNLPPMTSSSIGAIPIPRVGTPGIKPEHYARPPTPSGQSGIKKASVARRRRAEAVRAQQAQQREREASMPEEEEDEDEDEDDEDNPEDKRLYCMCQQVSYGSMVGCDDKDCPFEWFHWGCVGLTEEPSGKWYCPTCRVRREKIKGTRG